MCGELFTPAEVRDYLISECDEADGAAAWAARHGFTYEAARLVISGTRSVSVGIASALGFEKVTLYRSPPSEPGIEAEGEDAQRLGSREPDAPRAGARALSTTPGTGPDTTGNAS